MAMELLTYYPIAWVNMVAVKDAGIDFYHSIKLKKGKGMTVIDNRSDLIANSQSEKLLKIFHSGSYIYDSWN